MISTIGKAEQVAPGAIEQFQVEGHAVAVANVDGTLYAFSDICTHVGCSLSEGPLSGKVIICPCHGSQFDVTTGAVLAGPAAAPVQAYPLTVVDGEIRLTLPDPAKAAPAAAAPPPPPPAREAPAPTSVQTALAHVALFEGLDQRAIATLEGLSFRKTFGPGELIVEEGRTGNGLYVVLTGKVEVVKRLGSDRAQVVATLGPGEPFGEMALLGEWPRTASVRAIDETECLGMDRWVFLAHLEREPKLAVRMLQVLAQRLMEAGEKLAE